jgi:hypothetical protein
MMASVQWPMGIGSERKVQIIPSADRCPISPSSCTRLLCGHIVICMVGRSNNRTSSHKLKQIVRNTELCAFRDFVFTVSF